MRDRGSRLVTRNVAVGLVLAMSAAVLIGDALGGSAVPAVPDAPAARAAVTSGAPRLVVTKVTASSTTTSTRAHWSLRAWDGNSGARLAGPMSGAAVAIWGEDLGAPPSEALLRWSAPHVLAMIETAGS
ncbi:MULTISPECIES: hypothetical protein [unclassified Curtobacterium]|uniref:hypothetical protein n=1 Tax=unclassified Curtobacterium TaxID=257496 RepID=UPI0039AF405A